jgi:hypothetical protein
MRLIYLLGATVVLSGGIVEPAGVLDRDCVVGLGVIGLVTLLDKLLLERHFGVCRCGE